MNNRLLYPLLLLLLAFRTLQGELPEQCPDSSVVAVYLWNRMPSAGEKAYVDQVKVDFSATTAR
jgi:hypothetical protein